MKKTNWFVLLPTLALIAAACYSPSTNDRRLNTGVWRATVEIQGQELPFNFEVISTGDRGFHVYLLNASERLLLDEASIENDSINIALHIFDANLKAKIYGDTLLRGEFVKNYADDYRLPFEAVYGVEYRFFEPEENISNVNIAGTYAVTFLHDGDTTNAIAMFQQQGEALTGTFMTPTGDYRFLEGNVRDSTFYLSTFDGNYSYLFRGFVQRDGSITGEFYSGKTWYETWVAKRDENATLPDADSMTYLKDGYDRITLSFPDVHGDTVSIDDAKYKGKVLVLQLLGTWCPNCMDETKFLAPWYDANRERGVEVLGLAYERKADFAYASARVKKMKEKMNVNYDILIAGTDKKAEAAETLPMLNAVIAFPTTIFIGKDGVVRKIHTGFSGPGTGHHYEQFKQDFNETVNALLDEGVTAKR